YFPRAGDAARVERAQASGRRGIVEGGACYGCVFTGGALQNLFTFAIMKRPSGSGLLATLSAVIVLLWVALKSTVITVIELARARARVRPLYPVRSRAGADQALRPAQRRAALRARDLRGLLHTRRGPPRQSRASGRAPPPRQRHQGPPYGPRARVLPAILQLHRGWFSVDPRRGEGGARARQRPRHRGRPER